MSGWVLHLLFAAAAVTVAAVAADDPPGAVETAFSFADPEIDESSGLAVAGDRVLTVDDSGDAPVVYVVDGKTGSTVGRTTYSQEPVEDVEGLALAPDGSLWVADIGDNDAARDLVSVYRLPPVRDGDRTVTAQRYDLEYPSGPQNAEAVMVDPRDGRLYVASKGVLGGLIYAAPRRLSSTRPNPLEEVGEARGVVTDGAFFPDGAHLVLRTYGAALVYDTSTWRATASMKLPEQPQGEGIAVTDEGRRFLVSSEGAGTDVLSVALSEGMLTAVRSESPTSAGTNGPRASDDTGAPAVAESQDGQPAWRDPAVIVASVAAVLLVGVALSGLRRRRAQSRSTT